MWVGKGLSGRNAIMMVRATMERERRPVLAGEIRSVKYENIRSSGEPALSILSQLTLFWTKALGTRLTMDALSPKAHCSSEVTAYAFYTLCIRLAGTLWRFKAH